LAVLGVLPLVLRLAPIGHGLPRNYVPDTHEVRQALGMARDRDLVPEVGRYSTYPNLVPYCLLPLYAAEYAVGRALGRWSGSGEFALRALEEPAIVHLPARVLTAVLGAACAWAVFRGARAAGLGRGAWVAGWLTATSLLHVQFSTQERPWAPMTLCIALAAWAAVAHARDGAARSLALSAALAGLAFAAHQAGLAAAGLPALAWLCSARGWRAGELAARARQALAAALAFAATALVLGHPYLLVHGSTAAADVSGVELLEDLPADVKALRFGVGGQMIVLALSPSSLARLTKALVGYDPALVLLALGGIAAALRARAARPVALFALAWAAFFMTNVNDHVRYLLPLAVLLPLAGGFAAERYCAGRAGTAVLALLLAVPLVQSARLGWLLARPDTRAEAEQRLSVGGGLVAIDRYGPAVDLDRASLERLARWRELGARERHRLDALALGIVPASGPGIAAVPLEDVLLYKERERRLEVRPEPAKELGSDPRRALERLGATAVLLAERRPASGTHLLAPLLGDVEPLWVASPAAGDLRPDECFLPTEMDFPLTALWRVARPGPRLALLPLR
jgi:hypothetical protein